jgi:aminoglycoside N3'-acetyltransferase
MLDNIRKRYFPKGIRRTADKLFSRVFRRTSGRKLVKAFGKLNIPNGAVICVHSMLSGFGYIPGGPQTIIRSIQKAVPECTIIMPSFPFSGTMVDYLNNNPPVFDVNSTPSKSGVLSEAFRLMPGTMRSYHPTHPCAALGPKAEELLKDTEWCPTPFGEESSYGRFCAATDAFLLLLHTNSSSIVHRIQESVKMPNLFLDKQRKVKGYNSSGKVQEYYIYVHRPKIPLYVAIDGKDSSSPRFVWMPDFSFLFPRYNRERILKNLEDDKGKFDLLERDIFFRSNRIYTSTTIYGSEILSVKVKEWMDHIQKSVLESIMSFEKHYNSQAEIEKGIANWH